MIARGASADGDFVFQHVVIPVGARTAWHTHPGPQMVVVTTGTVVRESRRWPPTSAESGDAFLEEPGDVHAGYNAGDTPVEMWTMTVVPAGAEPAHAVEG